MQYHDKERLLTLAKSLKIENRAFINGEYCKNKIKKTPVMSPMDGKIIQDITHSSEEDVNQAVSVAEELCAKGVWSQAQASYRKHILLKWADLIEQHADEIILLESLNTGKPIQDVINIDFPLSLSCLRWFAELADKVNNQEVPVDPSLIATVVREPLGVVAAIVPWNYPLLMAMWKIAPALASGNCLILKPSEKTPITTIKIAEFARQAGLPNGVFQVLPGDGIVGSWLSQHKYVDCVAFTGSTLTGKKILYDSANSNLKKVFLELGGKSAQIILSDYKNLQEAAKVVAASIYSNAGQVCDAGSRVIVHKRIKDEFAALLIDEAKYFQPKHPFEQDAKMGPLIDGMQMAHVLEDIEIAKKESQLIYGGGRTKVDTGGFYVEPTIFDCASNKLSHTQKEIFGPVLSLISFSDLDEAISIANDTGYGLCAGIWSGSIKTVHDVAKKLRAGTVWGNCYNASSNLNLPFGGVKLSGNSKDQSIHAYYKFTDLKSTIISLL